MAEVIDFHQAQRQFVRKSGSLASGREPPDNDSMEQRVAKLESAAQDMRERLTRIECKIDSLEKHGATKADLMSVKADMTAGQNRIIMWVVGAALFPHLLPLIIAALQKA